MKQCNHVRKGIVTNQPDGYDAARPHASRTVCTRTSCIEAATFWVQGTTGETAHFRPDPEIRALQPQLLGAINARKERKA